MVMQHTVQLHTMLATAAFSLFLTGCDREADVEYIDTFNEFYQACSYSEPCESEKRSASCIEPGTPYVQLCGPGGMALARLTGNGSYMCRCLPTNDVWVFDPETRKLNLREAPIDDYGNEIRDP